MFWVMIGRGVELTLLYFLSIVPVLDIAGKMLCYRFRREGIQCRSRGSNRFYSSLR
jgi:hypothetical protein